jgi:hypothetical protein
VMMDFGIHGNGGGDFTCRAAGNVVP